MKKIAIFTAVIISVVVFSGCGEKQEAKNDEKQIPNPVSDPAGYIPGMVALRDSAQKDIEDATSEENEKINNTLNENDMTTNPTAPDFGSPLLKKYSAAKIETNLGSIKVKLNNAETPLTVANFLALAQNNFYNGTKFHRVIKGFMIQGGDPNSKTTNTGSWGMGGPGYKFRDELKGTEKYPTGTLAMANSGPNTNGSQFFIVTASPAATLPPSYTVFGIVTEGLDTALKIENVKTTTNDRPVEDVTITKVEPLEK